jgi:transposase-like protein
VYEEGRDRIGSALRRMAEDLVKERRQVLELRRENRRLRDELEQLKAAQAQGKPDPGAASAGRRNP